MHSIEPLESRIALSGAINATTATFIDVDGDLVTIKFSKPIAQQVLYSTTFGAPSITGAEQILRIDLVNVTPAAAEGVNITIAAAPRDGNGDGLKDGDGHVNIGELRAAGKHLGTVSIPGDLGRIFAGNGSPTVAAVKTLTVDSMGEYGLSTGASVSSQLRGPVGSILVRGNVRGVSIYLDDGVGGPRLPLGTLAIGGSLIGGDTSGSGVISCGALGSAKIARDLQGGLGISTGILTSTGKITSLTVGGSVLGGAGISSGSIFAGELGTVKIGRDLVGGATRGGNALDSGVIDVSGNLRSLSIGGSILGNDAEGGGRINVGGDAGSIQIGGSLVGAIRENRVLSGTVVVTGKLTTLDIGGSVLGGAADFGAGIVVGTLVTGTIRGDVRGGTGEGSGQVTATSIGTLTIGGSLVGGTDPDRFDANDDGLASANILSSTGIARLSIGGDILGGSGIVSGSVAAATIGVLTVRGSVVGGPGEDSGSIFASATITSVQIGGDLLGGEAADDSGQIVGQTGIGKVQIGGSVVGGYNANGSGLIDGGTGRIATLTIGGDLRGGIGNVSGPITDSGSIHARSLGAVTIGGSVYAGVNIYNGTLLRVGWINADEAISSLNVKGDLIGNERNPVLITAGGDPAITIAKPDIAIGSITIGGNVDHTFILAGYNKNGIGVSADASVGAVKVGGDWIGSYLSAGVEPGVDLIFGTADDKLLLGGANFGGGVVRDNLSVSKIASIVIGGQIKSGQNDGLPFSGNQTYGFVAQQIGSFKYDDIVVPLRAGASNDTFALGKARPLGASRSSLNSDGFAMHVFEV